MDRNIYSSGGLQGAGQGGSSSMMMMVALIGCCWVCMVILSSGLFMFKDTLLRASSSSDTGGDTGADTTDDGTTPDAPVTSNLDGAKLITVGGISMNVKGTCGKGSVSFSESKNEKWVWNLKKAGDWNGIPYYTIESFYKNFASACSNRFLTAPTGCKSPPFLSKAEFGPRQYWLFVTDGTNYQLRNLACAQGLFPNSYLMQAAQKGKKRPMFSARSGSTFSITQQNTA